MNKEKSVLEKQMEEKENMVNKKISYVLFDKKEVGFLQVKTEKGEILKRKFKTHKKGRFEGKTTFNVWDNVYSMPTNLVEEVLKIINDDKDSDETGMLGKENISFEGRYNDIYKSEKSKNKVKEKEVDWSLPVKHERYNQIKVCIENNVPVYLVGPAGSGKNYTLEQIADELGYNFYFSNSVQQEYKLTGFIDAGGDYHNTEFYKACKEAEEGNDVIFFLDEMDASIPEVLVLLNAAIANGYFEFPNGKIVFGEKVHFVAAGNTFGNGADEQYTGRLVLDQATLDRFAVMDFGYDKNIELSLCKGNTSLVSFIEALRFKSEDIGIRGTYSYRCITMVTKLEKFLPLEQVLMMAVLKGFDMDTIKTLNVKGENKYFKALRKIQGEKEMKEAQAV